MPATQEALHFLSQLKTTTTAAISRDFTEDRIWLNGREEDVGQPRLQACLRESEWGPQGCWGQARPAPSPVPLPRAGRVRVHRRRCRRHPPPHPPYLPHAPGAVDARQHSWVWAWGLGSPEKEVCMRSSDRGPSPPCLPMGLSSVPAVRRLARKRGSDGHEDPLPLSLSYKVHVASVNNFPTAAGLASSAAGYACLGGCPGWVPVLCPRHSAVALAVSYV